MFHISLKLRNNAFEYSFVIKPLGYIDKDIPSKYLLKSKIYHCQVQILVRICYTTKHLCILVPAPFFNIFHQLPSFGAVLHKSAYIWCKFFIMITTIGVGAIWEEFVGQHQHQSNKKSAIFILFNTNLAFFLCTFWSVEGLILYPY